MVVALRAQNPAPTPASSAGGLLPEGTGRELVQRTCSECHALERILGTRENLDGWVRIVNDMASRGAIATDEEFDQIVAYLVEHFGRPARPVRPNFAGIWMMVEPRAGSSLTVAQSETELRVTKPDGVAVYKLDGTPGDGTGRWEGGAKLVITSTAVVNGKPVEQVTFWSLDTSGNLVIEGAATSGSVKTIYKREPKS